MAVTTANVAPNNATAAEFRAWAQFVHDVFANGTWVQTADTGQINLTTVGAPGAVNTKMGFEIWRMDDTHQAAAPIFLKLAYGSGSGSVNLPAIWFAVGTATDGSGNLIDSNDADRAAYLMDFYSQTAAPIQCRASSATLHNCFGSAAKDRAVFAQFESKPTLQYTGNNCEFVNVTGPDCQGSLGNFTNAFSIERGRDSSGATISTHIFVQWTQTAQGSLGASQYVSTSNSVIVHNNIWGTVSAKPAGAATIPIYQESANAALPSAGAAYGIIPFIQSTKPTWPGVNVVVSPHPIFEFTQPPGNCAVAFNATYVTGRTGATSPYGTSRTYRTVAGLRGGQFGAGGSNRDDSAYIWILYE